MRVFKCALEIVFRNPLLLIIYAVALSFMGVAMASSAAAAPSAGGYERVRVDYAVIDRDDSELSRGIAAFLETQGDRVEIADTRVDLQDAVAKGEAGYVLIVPEGYADAFAAAVESGGEPPEMEAVYSFYSVEGSLVDTELSNYVSTVKTYMASGMTDADAAASALAATEERASVEVVASEGTGEAADQFCVYMQFGTYVFFAAIIACLGSLLSTLNRKDIRSRNLASPVSYLSCNGQVALACIVVTAVVWAWVFALGAVCFPGSLGSIAPAGVALIAAGSFSFALVPLAVAFLVGQTGAGTIAANAIGNISGLVVSFLGGCWVPLELVAPEVVAVAHFLPGFWYTDALSRAAHLADGSWEGVAPVLGNIGVILLFAAAIFCVGLLVGRMRVRTAESGGSSGAAGSVYGAS